MYPYLLRRIASIVPVMLGVSALVFLMMRVSTPDPAALIAGQQASSAQVDALQNDLGLNQPLFMQLIDSAQGILHGDFGKSYMTRLPALSVVMARTPATIELSVLVILVASASGIALGTFGLLSHNRLLAGLSAIGSSLGLSIPSFWLSLLLIVVFGVTLGLSPIAGRTGPEMAPIHITGLFILDSLFTGDWSALRSALHHLFLPVLALAIPMASMIARITRSSLQDAVSQDYIRTARAKGLKERVVVGRHGLRNALPAIIAIIGMQFGRLLSGVIVVETIFAWPGLGLLLVDAVLAGDFPVVQGVVLVTSFTYLVVSLGIDILCALLTPVIRYV